MEPIWIGCPPSNCRKGRPLGFRPEAVVVHIMDGSFAAGESVFLNPDSQKSAHYGISKSGLIHQYVDEHDVAFHAGIVVNPTWPLLKPGVNPNFYTIGIEHEGRPDDVWPAEQTQASTVLVGSICARWGIARDVLHIIRHHQIRASKTCPGNWLQIDQFVQQVPAMPALTPAPALTVRALKNVNLRQSPNLSAAIARVISANMDVSVSGFTVGERVNGNAFWYMTAQNQYLWAGATDVPRPSAAAHAASGAM